MERLLLKSASSSIECKVMMKMDGRSGNGRSAAGAGEWMLTNRVPLLLKKQSNTFTIGRTLEHCTIDGRKAKVSLFIIIVIVIVVSAGITVAVRQREELIYYYNVVNLTLINGQLHIDGDSVGRPRGESENGPVRELGRLQSRPLADNRRQSNR
jgi:hypothetical protein